MKSLLPYFCSPMEDLVMPTGCKTADCEAGLSPGQSLFGHAQLGDKRRTGADRQRNPSGLHLPKRIGGRG